MSRPFVEQNPKFAPTKNADRRFILPYGGAGSGKSVFTAQHMIEKCLRQGNHFVLLVRKVKGDIRDSNFAQVQKILNETPLHRRAKIRRQEMRISFDTGSEMKGFGLDDSERLKSVTDPTVVWVEEANQITEQDFTQLNLRLRGKMGVRFQIWLTFNPNIGKSHWIRRRFFNEKTRMDESRFFALRTTWEDNAFVDDEYGEELERLPEGERKVYLHGAFHDTADPDQVITSDSVEAAFERDPTEIDPPERFEEVLEGKGLGADVARFGDDLTSLAYVQDGVLSKLESTEWSRTTMATNWILAWMEGFDLSGKDVAVDTVGLGAGVADQLFNADVQIREFKAGSSAVEDPVQKDSFFKFSNVRSQAWWWLRTLLKDGHIAFDIDPGTETATRLEQDLTAPRYRVKGDKKLEVEPKRGSKTWGMAERLGRSTDEGDAVVQAFFVRRLPDPDPVDYARI